MCKRPIFACFALLALLGQCWAQVPETDAAPYEEGPLVEATDFREPARYWAEGGYIVRWIKPVCLKPVVLTTGSPPDAVPGALGQPNTQVVMGDHKFEFNGASGFQSLLGGWLNPEQTVALEGGGFMLEQATARQEFQAVAGTPASFIAFQSPTNVQSAIPFTVPGVIDGSATAVGSSRLWGVEANLTGMFRQETDSFLFEAGLLGGVRYLDLRDRVRVTNTLSLVADPSTFAVGEDTFTTRNLFVGPQLGCKLSLTRGAFALEYLTKFAAGLTHQINEIDGNPLLRQSRFTTLVPGPLLALPSNISRTSTERVTLVPEVGFKSRWQFAPWGRLVLGYSLLYWNKVLCPGDQMDPHANITQLPFNGPVVGPKDPQPLFVHTDFFAHGLDVSLEARY